MPLQPPVSISSCSCSITYCNALLEVVWTVSCIVFSFAEILRARELLFVFCFVLFCFVLFCFVLFCVCVQTRRGVSMARLIKEPNWWLAWHNCDVQRQPLTYFPALHTEHLGHVPVAHSSVREVMRGLADNGTKCTRTLDTRKSPIKLACWICRSI